MSIIQALTDGLNEKQILQALNDSNEDLNANQAEKNALYLALARNYSSALVTTLLNKGADMYIAAECAAKKHAVNILDKIYQTKSIAEPQKTYQQIYNEPQTSDISLTENLFFIAASSTTDITYAETRQLVIFFIENKARFSATRKPDESTVLIEAAKVCNASIAAFILQEDKDSVLVNMQDNSKSSAMDYACKLPIESQRERMQFVLQEHKSTHTQIQQKQISTLQHRQTEVMLQNKFELKEPETYLDPIVSEAQKNSSVVSGKMKKLAHQHVYYGIFPLDNILDQYSSAELESYLLDYISIKINGIRTNIENLFYRNAIIRGRNCFHKHNISPIPAKDKLIEREKVNFRKFNSRVKSYLTKIMSKIGYTETKQKEILKNYGLEPDLQPVTIDNIANKAAENYIESYNFISNQNQNKNKTQQKPSPHIPNTNVSITADDKNSNTVFENYTKFIIATTTLWTENQTKPKKNIENKPKDKAENNNKQASYIFENNEYNANQETQEKTVDNKRDATHIFTGTNEYDKFSINPCKKSK